MQYFNILSCVVSVIYLNKKQILLKTLDFTISLKQAVKQSKTYSVMF